MSRTAKKQSGENSLISADELKDIKENLSSLSLDVAEVLKNQKQMQQLFGTIQILQKELKQQDEKILQLEEKLTTSSSTSGKTTLSLLAYRQDICPMPEQPAEAMKHTVRMPRRQKWISWKSKSLTFLNKMVLNSLQITFQLVIRLENHEMESSA